MKKLAKVRKARGLSQTELAERLMTSQAAVCKWENSVNKPHRATVKRICDALQCRPADIA